MTETRYRLPATMGGLDYPVCAPSAQSDDVTLNVDGYAVSLPLALLTPVEPPAPPLPPTLEPGFYLDASGDCWQVYPDGDLIGFGDEIFTGWRDGHKRGPFTRLGPVSDVVSMLRTLYDAANEGRMPLPSTMHEAHALLIRAEASR